MWPSFETASSLYDWFNLILLGAAATGVVATGIVVWMGNIKEGYLRRDLADATERTEKLKAVVAWRTIAPDVATTLENALAAHPGSVNLRYTDGDPEALFLAIQVSQILAKAHWQVAPGAIKPDNAIVFGIALPDGIGQDAQTLRTAFGTENLPFSTSPVPPAGVKLFDLNNRGCADFDGRLKNACNAVSLRAPCQPPNNP